MLKFLTNSHSSSSSPTSISIFVFVVVAVLCCSFTPVRSDPIYNDPAYAVNPCVGTPLPTPGSCPVKCFRTDPVCGVDGKTYWCGCAEAMCAGTRVAKLGFCEVGSGGSAPLSGQALLLVHIVWLIVLGFSVLFGLF